jgi:hypothetical protein
MAAQLNKWFQTRRFLWEFPIGSYVKLSSAVVAILVGGLKCRTHIWKGTTQGSFQQSLVEIGYNCNQTLGEWSLDGPLPNLYPVIPTSNQDGRQAKNRKRGDAILGGGGGGGVLQFVWY